MIGVRAIVWWSAKTRSKTVGLLVLAILVTLMWYMPFPTQPMWMTLPLDGWNIVLDAGHGGVDGGAVSFDGKIEEKTITLDITLKLRALLETAGAVVTVLREEDVDLAQSQTKGYSRRKTEDLYARFEAIRRVDPDLFLSIHANAMSLKSVRGPQTFYTLQHADNVRLAGVIQEQLRNEVTPTPRVATRMKGIFLLDHVRMPATLIEVGFLSHEEESRKLADEVYRLRIAEAIYRGVLSYASSVAEPT